MPERHELDRGEVQHRDVLRAVAETDYDGYIGLEYWPSYENSASLRAMIALIRGAAA